MAHKKIYLFVIIVHLFFVSSCSNDDDKKVYLEVADIHLKDIGRIPAKFEFDIESVNDSVKKCTIITRAIKKNDTIESIKIVMQGKELNIDIISNPYDFDCADDSCFTAHSLNFNIIYLNKGYYNICTRVNYSETNNFYYSIK